MTVTHEVVKREDDVVLIRTSCGLQEYTTSVYRTLDSLVEYGLRRC